MHIRILKLFECWTNPDIEIAVAELSRFASDGQGCHWNFPKCFLKYFKGTKDIRLVYSNEVLVH